MRGGVLRGACISPVCASRRAGSPMKRRKLMFVYGLFDYLLTCVLAFGAGVASAYLYSTRKPRQE